MDLLSIQAICGVVVIFLLSSWWAISKKSDRAGKAPELGGAWPVIGHLRLLGGSRPFHEFLADASDKCGPAFSLRIGSQNMLVVSSWELAKECFTTNDKILASRTSSVGGKYLGYNNALFSFSSYGPYWRDVRKIATVELLSNRRLQLLKLVRISEVATRVKELYKRSVDDKGPVRVEMKQWFEDLNYNVVAMMITGNRYLGSTAVGDERETRRFLEAVNHLIYLLKGPATMISLPPLVEWLDIGGHQREMKRTAKEVDSVLASWLDEHRRKKRSSLDSEDAHFIDVLISILESGDYKFPDYDQDTVIKATCMSIVLGGTETTTTTMTWTLSLLLKYPEVLQKVQDELDTHVGKERCVDESDIPNLTYLQAVIKETLRLYTPLPVAIPHEAMEDCTIGGFNVRAGTRVVVNLWKIHRDSRVWSDPLEFRPERFLVDHVDVDLRGNHFELIPFGSGRRSCPGLSFGLQIVYLTLARLIHGFDVRMQSDSPVDMSEKVGGTISRATPLDVFVTPRLPSKCYE